MTRLKPRPYETFERFAAPFSLDTHAAAVESGRKECIDRGVGVFLFSHPKSSALGSGTLIS